MRILIVLTYYRPHTSGLTIYAERLAKAFARRGHSVTVLTSHFRKDLPYDEIVEGVRIVRVPVLFRLSKGVIMPTIGLMATRLVREADVIQLHLPQFDAAGISLRGRLSRKPTVVTYHCDLRMPPGWFNRLANRAITIANHLTATWTHRIVTYTRDYAEHSQYLQPFMDKVEIIPPPVELPDVSAEEARGYIAKTNPENKRPVIGMAARFATEKGVEVLLNAMPAILEKHPQAQVQFAGPYQKIIGEEHYFQRLLPTIQKYQQGGNWHFLGELNQRELTGFYRDLDVLVIPSLNSTEAFGLVQIEAMMNNVPCVASNLPGVRQPTQIHSMGKVVEIGDSAGLAQAVLEILSHHEQYRCDPQEITRQYNPDTIAARYEELFATLAKEIKS